MEELVVGFGAVRGRRNRAEGLSGICKLRRYGRNKENTKDYLERAKKRQVMKKVRFKGVGAQ